jgi:hypothetical protein
MRDCKSPKEMYVDVLTGRIKSSAGGAVENETSTRYYLGTQLPNSLPVSPFGYPVLKIPENPIPRLNNVRFRFSTCHIGFPTSG